jgi:ABC-2 type transport system ATP-binding protein
VTGALPLGEVVAAEAVSRSFGGLVALRELTFRLAGPGVVGLLGPNGAGKSTLLGLLEGLLGPSAGTLRLFGAPLSPRYPKRRVGAILQNEAALDGMTVGDYADFYAAVYGVADGVARILSAAELAERRRTLVDRLSGGQAQRLFLAAACVHQPDLLLLDEPTANLDPAARRRLGADLRMMAGRRAVLLATHDLAEAEAVCDRALFLVGGELRAQGTLAELVAAVPGGRGLEDAFFHFCGARLDPRGELS